MAGSVAIFKSMYQIVLLFLHLLTHLQIKQASQFDWEYDHSFANRMPRRADQPNDGVPVLLLDRSYRIEANGLYDDSKMKCKCYFNILDNQHIDLICPRNCEMSIKRYTSPFLCFLEALSSGQREISNSLLVTLSPAKMLASTRNNHHQTPCYNPSQRLIQIL